MYRALDSPGPIVPVVSVITDAMLSGPGAGADSPGLDLALERASRSSLQQVSGWLRLSYPDNEEMQVSHETIYRALYVQARGSLRGELTRHLRTGRQKRFARAHSNRGQGPGRIAGMVMISERPPEVCDRAVPGHWEGDLLMGPATRRRPSLDSAPTG